MTLYDLATGKKLNTELGAPAHTDTPVHEALKSSLCPQLSKTCVPQQQHLIFLLFPSSHTIHLL